MIVNSILKTIITIDEGNIYSVITSYRQINKYRGEFNFSVFYNYENYDYLPKAWEYTYCLGDESIDNVLEYHFKIVKYIYKNKRFVNDVIREKLEAL